MPTSPTTFPQIELELDGLLLSASLNHETGVLTVGSNTLAAQAGVLDEGDWWRVWITKKGLPTPSAGGELRVAPAATALADTGSVLVYDARFTQSETVQGVGVGAPIQANTWYEYDLSNLLGGTNSIKFWSDGVDTATVNEVEVHRTVADTPGSRATARNVDLLREVVDDYGLGVLALHYRVLAAEAALYDPTGGLAARAAEIDTLRLQITDGGSGIEAVANRTTQLSTTVGGHTTTIEQQAVSINGLEGKWSVKIDANGYVAGFGLSVEQDPLSQVPKSTSTFIVLADTFAIALPGQPADTFPFVVGNIGGTPTIGISADVYIDGDLIVNGTIIGDKILGTTLAEIKPDLGVLEAGTFKTTGATGYRVEISSEGTFPIWYGTGVKSAGNAKFYTDTSGNAVFSGTLSAANGTFAGEVGIGQTVFNTGVGLWAGHVGADFKFSLGSAAGDSLTYNAVGGGELRVSGRIVGMDYVVGTAYTVVQSLAAFDADAFYALVEDRNWYKVKEAVVDRYGDVTVTWEMKNAAWQGSTLGDGSCNGTLTEWVQSETRIEVRDDADVIVSTSSAFLGNPAGGTSADYKQFQVDVTGLRPGYKVAIYGRAGPAPVDIDCGAYTAVVEFFFRNFEITVADPITAQVTFG